MALVDHVFAHGIESVQLPSLAVTVNADVADGDLFYEVCDEAGDVDEVVCVGNEERVGGGHVGEIIIEGWECGCAEETRGGRDRWVVGLIGCGGGLGRVGCAVEHGFLVLFGVEVGSVGVFCRICLSGRSEYGGVEEERGIPAGITAGCCLRWGVLCALCEFVGKEGSADWGEAGDSALDVIAVVVGVVV